MPFSIIGSTEDVRTPDGRVAKGREYIWGVAEGLHFHHFPLSFVVKRDCSREREPL